MKTERLKIGTSFGGLVKQLAAAFRALLPSTWRQLTGRDRDTGAGCWWLVSAGPGKTDQNQCWRVDLQQPSSAETYPGKRNRGGKLKAPFESHYKSATLQVKDSPQEGAQTVNTHIKTVIRLSASQSTKPEVQEIKLADIQHQC